MLNNCRTYFSRKSGTVLTSNERDAVLFLFLQCNKGMEKARRRKGPVYTYCCRCKEALDIKYASSSQPVSSSDILVFGILTLLRELKATETLGNVYVIESPLTVDIVIVRA